MSRVDIEIAARSEFVVHIENKILSLEGSDQTDREWEDLEKRRRELGSSESNTHAIFLTLDGSDPREQEISGRLDGVALPAFWRSLPIKPKHPK